MRKVLKSLPICLLVLLATSCSTEKDRWLNRGYHNMTARYNGYYNAKEIIFESLYDYRYNVKEDYTQILPIHNYPNEEQATEMGSQMEIAIEKTSKVITKHSMPDPTVVRDKNEEWCKWIDENWLVMGQAYFYKREFGEARDKFRFVRATYEDDPIVYYADLWLARTMIETGDYGNAFPLLQKMEETLTRHEEDYRELKRENKEIRRENKGRRRKKKTTTPIFPSELQKDLILEFANLHLQKEEYDEAALRLIEVLPLIKKRKEKARYYFILGQIHQELGDNSRASYFYELAKKKTATYDMEFYANIYSALLYSGGDTQGVRRTLRKMLKDDKNKEFLDQIYYALAELDLKEGEKESGIENLLLSAKNSVSNDVQKAKTYERLGTIYYEDKDYRNAKAFYDSSLSVMDEEHEKYEVIVNRSIGLTDLVENLETYEVKDSLLTLEEKGERYYLKVIDGVIEDYIEEQERKKREQEERAAAASQLASGRGGWYFYNQEAKTFGYNEFKKFWGDRALEDNWRRSDKSSLAINAAEEEDSTGSVNDPTSREYYLKDIPLTDEMKQAYREDIASALYNLGVLYRERFQENEQAKRYFQELVERYSPDETILPACFQLYTLLKEMNDLPGSNKYKDIILDLFPDSEYARILKDPDYLARKAEEEKKYERKYNETYSLFTQGEFQQTVSQCEQMLEEEANAYIPKFLLLKTYAVSKLWPEEVDKIIPPLERLVKEFRETDEGVRAKAILDRIRNEESRRQVEAGTSNYVYNADMEHFFVLVYPNSEGNVNDVKRKVSNFNTANYRSKGYKTSNLFIDQENQIVVVKSFENKDEAMRYFNAFQSDQQRLPPVNQKYQSFVITHKNYAAFYIDKDIDAYIEFFKQNYQ